MCPQGPFNRPPPRGPPMCRGTPMFGNAAVLDGLHVTGKCRDRNMQLTCSRPAAWDPHTHTLPTRMAQDFPGRASHVSLFISLSLARALSLSRHSQTLHPAPCTLHQGSKESLQAGARINTDTNANTSRTPGRSSHGSSKERL